MQASSCALRGKPVAPGDVVLEIPPTGEVRIGPGLRPGDTHILSTKAGVLQQTRAGKLWIAGRQRRYIPAEEDLVVGVITDRHVENFTVDIGAPFPALLPQLSFEGATKRNRPTLIPGDVVCARVVAANRDTDPVLSCVDSSGHAGGLGQLKEGLLFKCSTALARKLLAKPLCPILEALSQSLKFELAVGLNGSVWVNSPDTTTTVLISNAVQRSEFLTRSQAQQLVAHLVPQVQGSEG